MDKCQVWTKRLIGLPQCNFSLLWWGGLISLMGNRVLFVALLFYVYQQPGSTGATVIMVMATTFRTRPIAGGVFHVWLAVNRARERWLSKIYAFRTPVP